MLKKMPQIIFQLGLKIMRVGGLQRSRFQMKIFVSGIKFLIENGIMKIKVQKKTLN